MDQREKASIPPEQNEGIKKDLEERVSFEVMEDAEEMFVIAKERLLLVNNWHIVSKSIDSKFQIVDHHGHPVDRHAHTGDIISIDIPGPSSVTGDGKDWVKVEAIEYDDYPDENKEVLAMRLRPVSNPTNTDESVAHFFTNDATSTFVLERDHNDVIARYFGRNEKPNTHTGKLADKVRNTVVGVSAILGFSDVQWKGLLKGFLDVDD
jgi:hypothetical protein